MEVKAKLSYLRIAPRKVRLVADSVRDKNVEEAQRILNFIVKKAAKDILKLLKQAIANAKNNFQLEESNLYISKIMVNEGPKLKRWMPRSRGRANEIQKKTSHIILVLSEITEKKIKTKKIKKSEELAQESDKQNEEVVGDKKPQVKYKPEKDRAKPSLPGQRLSKRFFRRETF
jgi:large subunit ribosomal protein L22